MNRGRLVALVVAAAVGTAGGTGAAIVAADSGSSGAAPEREDAASGTITPSGPQAAANEPLLYYAGGVLHDGDDTVDLDVTGSFLARSRLELPSALVRRDGGYVIAVPSEIPDAEDVWTVEEDGTETLVGSLAPGWDLNLPGTRLVGHDLAEDLLTVYDTASGDSVARWDGSFDARDSVGYAGKEDQVLVSQRLNARDYRLRRWDVSGGSTSTEPLVGYDRMGVSPRGSWVAGTVGPDGAGSDDQAFCLQLHPTYLSGEDVFWQDCDWRPPMEGRPDFSPDGSRLLVVPSSGEGAETTGPAQYAVIDASEGPDPLVAQFDAPDGAVDGTWADDTSIWVVGLDDAEDTATSWVRRCDLDGECAETVSDEAGEIVLGELR